MCPSTTCKSPSELGRFHLISPDRNFNAFTSRTGSRFSNQKKLIGSMKRDRSGEDLVDGEVIDSLNDTAACALMLLSKVGGSDDSKVADVLPEVSVGGRAFTCKTCGRNFSSFQALGGHRASHKKPRLLDDTSEATPAKPKAHECSICGLEFPIGQALGGHMRRHRAEMLAASAVPQVPVLNKSVSSKRVTLCLDLNLSPFENDLRMMLLSA
ncbi:hypothetical protein SAY86_008683 [Trapa natans]|uniref:C2H2-type domain-containing protein n=1 Tax=Trapa natans TaxID=22666 RepID=A0AAN7K910_TRANT|nr:hypothetical protein SAY86_008683 [Trapa natans]